MQVNELRELAMLFTRLGLTAFGGPAAHIALFKYEVVDRRGWMSEQHLLDLIGATNLIPGPNSSEVVMHIGRERAGWAGLVVAGLCFILPAALISGVFAWMYQQYGQLPEVQPFVYGIKPAIIAIVLTAIYPLAKKSLKSTGLRLIGLAAFLLSLFQYNEIFILFGAGLLALLPAALRGSSGVHAGVFWPILQIPISTAIGLTQWALFLKFLKIGALLYGSGYVLFAFLDAEFVAQGFITKEQLIDAIAVGQLTPGPLLSAVTFLGYQISGVGGAVLATAGVFLPAFLFVALLHPMVAKMRNSSLFSVFLDAVNVASVAVIIVVCYEMGKESITDWRTALIAVAGFGVLLGFKKINSVFVVTGGALAGWLLTVLWPL